MKKLRITQVISKNGATKKQVANLQSLGIRKIHQTVELEMNPVLQGMLDKVLHLVKVEEI